MAYSFSLFAGDIDILLPDLAAAYVLVQASMHGLPDSGGRVELSLWRLL